MSTKDRYGFDDPETAAFLTVSGTDVDRADNGQPNNTAGGNGGNGGSGWAALEILN